MGRKKDGYSAQVAIHLLAEGMELPVSQVGRDFLILTEPREIRESTAAQIVVNVDGRLNKRHVVLFEGATLDREVVRFF